jgi:hypothetical protein
MAMRKATAGVAVIATAAVEASLILGRFVHKLLNWNNEAKEKELKGQFTDHVTKKQQLTVELTSTNFSKHVEQ